MSQINYGPDDPVAVPADYRVPLTGESILPRSSLLIINPAGTIAAFTLLLPANALDGQKQALKTTAIVTALTVTAATGDTVDAAPADLNADAYFELTYVKSVSTWFLSSATADPDPT